MSVTQGATIPPVDQPVFVLGERPAAVRLVEALGRTPVFCAVPTTRLLPELVGAADRCLAAGGRVPGLALEDMPAQWYRDVQTARLLASGKLRTVEFSALSILRLCQLYPRAQFVVVRDLSRAVPRSRRPALETGRIFEVDSHGVDLPPTLERVLAFLGEAPEPVELDLSDRSVRAMEEGIAPLAKRRR